MSSNNKPKPSQRKKNVLEKAENLTKVLNMSKTMQTRFQLIPPTALNKVTVAGIRDMSLGRVKDGKPVGANVIRVNNPSPNTKSDFHRICIDPAGVSNKNNPHIKISPGTVKLAENVQSGLKVTGKVLFVISLVASGVRVAKSIYDEVTIDEEIESLKQIISSLEEDLTHKELTGLRRQETEEALEYSKELLEEALDNKNHPGKKTLVTLVCISGEYGGAAIGGIAGAKAGAAIGAVGGPIGAVGGAVAGSLIGAIVGSQAGGSIVTNFKCDSEGLSTEMHGSLIEFGKDSKGEVLGLKGNLSIDDDGLSTGVGTSLFEVNEENEGNFALLKIGAKVNANKSGLDMGVEGKVVRGEAEFDKVKVGVGINLDTGLKIAKDGFKVEALGFGFSNDNGGFGIKLPFFDIKFKK